MKIRGNQVDILNNTCILTLLSMMVVWVDLDVLKFAIHRTILYEFITFTVHYKLECTILSFIYPEVLL
jgi:hypothetical protein